MENFKINIISLFATISTLFIFFIISLVISNIMNTDALIPAVFILAVFLISLSTEGYIYGIIASLLSVLMINFAFTFPYFQFDFLIPENLVSAIILFVITTMTCTLTNKNKQQERIRAESEKQRMRANLLRAVSHDIRTPLTTIYGSSSSIIDEYDHLSDQQVISLIQGIKEDSDWLISMVENLLMITRIDNQEVNIIKNSTVLEELIDSVLIKFKKRFPDQKIIVSLPDDIIIIPMDALLIQQVLLNLLENAVFHAKGMQHLYLNVYVVENQAVFEVVDDGIGIDKDELSSLFDGYLKKKDIVDSKKNSMGVGLSVCASIVKAHNGHIEAFNLKDRGSCFRFTLEMEG